MRGIHEDSIGNLGGRGRAALMTIIGSRLRDELAPGGRGVEEAETAVAAMRAWVSGEHVPAERLSDLAANEEGGGLALYAWREEPNFKAWSTLTSAVLYVAYQAYRQQGKRPRADVVEVTEDVPAEVFQEWRKTSSFDENLWHRAVMILSDHQREAGDSPIDIDRIMAELKNNG